MQGSVRLIKRTKRFLMYEVPDVSLINNQFIDGIDWPVDSPVLVLNFKTRVSNDFELINKNLSGKYLSRLIYRANKNKLISSMKGVPSPDIHRYRFRNIKELQELYLMTEKKYFGEPWSKNLGHPWKQYFEGDYLKAIQTNAEKHLSEERVICFGKNKIPVALLPVKETKYFDDTNIDWILWIWIDSNLSKEERGEIRNRFVNWLKIHALEQVVTGVNPFNIASNKFFKKIGFRSECLQITRPDY